MRNLAVLIVCVAAALAAAACVPIGVKSTTLPYASADAPRAIAR